jgi:hypothetical protein
VKEILKNIFEENAVETLTCKQWLTTDRLTLDTIMIFNISVFIMQFGGGLLMICVDLAWNDPHIVCCI